MKEEKKSRLPSTSQQLILGVLVFINVVRSIGGTSISIGLPDLIEELNGDASSYGIVIAIFSLMAMLFQTPTAIISDKIGRKKSILLSMGIYLTGTSLCFFAKNITQLIIFRAIQGSGAYSSVLISVISDKFSKEERSRAISYFTISLVGGYLVGNLLGGVLVGVIGPQGVFLFNSAMVLIAILIVIFRLPETNPTLTLSKEEKKKRNFHFLVEKRYVFGLALQMIKSFIMFGTMAYQIWLYTKGFGLSPLTTTVLLIPSTLIYIGGNFLSPFFSKKLGSLNLFLLGGIGILIFSAFLLVNYNLYWFIIFSFLNLFFLGIFEPEITSFTQNYIPRQERGFGNGVYNTIGFLFRALGEMAIPAISVVWGYTGVYSVVTGMALILVILLLFFRFQLKKQNIPELA
jgi:MFS family permease